jgi:hypothetical protein
MSKYCDRKKINLEILTYLHIFSPPDYDKAVFGMPFVCLCMYGCASRQRLNS